MLFVAIVMLPTFVFAAADFPLKKGSSGVEVVRLQLRLVDLGYIQFRATGRYGDMTYRGVLRYQRTQRIAADGYVGDETYMNVFSSGAPRQPQNDKLKKVFGPGAVTPAKTSDELMIWAEVDKLIPVGSTFKIVDFNTNSSFTVTRTGGANHAEVRTVEDLDYEAYLRVLGGEYTWEKRAAIVEVGGHRLPASFFGMPTENFNPKNLNMAGSFCLFFNESRSDIWDLLDSEHTTQIARAAGQ